MVAAALSPCPGWQDALLPAYQNNQVYSQDGMYFMMKIANSITGVTGFDASFETVEGTFNCPNTECKYDIKLSGIDGDIWAECKSYQTPSLIPKNQFLKYFTRPDVRDLNQVRYYFNKEKLSTSLNSLVQINEAEDKAKKGIRTILNSRYPTEQGPTIASTIYNANPAMFNNLNLKLDNGELVNNAAKFELFCQQTSVSGELYNFIIVK